jgi:hypothetical protein
MMESYGNNVDQVQPGLYFVRFVCKGIPGDFSSGSGFGTNTVSAKVPFFSPSNALAGTCFSVKFEVIKGHCHDCTE